MIANNEKDCRRKETPELLNKHREGTRPIDRELTRKWEKERPYKQIPSFTENTINNGTVNGGTIVAGTMSKERKIRPTLRNDGQELLVREKVKKERQEESDDDFMPVRQPKREILSLSKNKESAGSTKAKNIQSSSRVPRGAMAPSEPSPSTSEMQVEVESEQSDDDFMPVRLPKRKILSLSKNKESAGSKKAKTTKSIPSSSSRVVPRGAMAPSEPSSSTSEMESGQVLLPSSSKTSPSDELEIEDGIEDENEKVEFDINTIIKQLEMQPKVEWRVDNINVSQRFRQYQQMAIDKLRNNNGLKWDDTFEILALSSIIVLSSQCPYPNFTNLEWHKIIRTNPYQLQLPVIPQSISNALLEASRKHVVGEDSYMHPERSELSRAAARTFNDLQELPTLSDKKLSENLHCCRLLHPYVNPLFFGNLKEYETRLDRSVSGTRKRPDISCVVNGTPILNSEVKPLGYTPLQKKKDSVKVQLRAKKSVNEQLNTKGGPGEAAILMNMGEVVETFFMDLKFSGLYRSWPFHTTKLAIDKPSMPLIESTFCHFVALERKVNELAENFKSRKEPFTPPSQILSFMNEIPDSPQIKRLFGKKNR